MKNWIVFCLAVVLISCSSSYSSKLSTTLEQSIQSTGKPAIDLTIIPTQKHELTAILTVTPTENQSTITPTPLPLNVVSDTIFAYFKEGSIYVADYSGDSLIIYNMEEEDQTKQEKPKMKLSPDWKYIAYIGVSGGTQPAIKVIDIENKKKIFQDIFPNAIITDFAWSTDSKNIVAAYDYKNGKDNFSGFISILDPISQEGRKTLFDPENMEVTQIEWPNTEKIVFSYLSYGKDTFHMASIASYDINSKMVIRRNISSMERPNFWLTISPDKVKVLFYNNPGGGNVFGPYIKTMMSINTLQNLPCSVCGYPQIININWFDHYILGLSDPNSGSVDQGMRLYDLEGNRDALLFVGGPESWAYILRVIQKNGRSIALFWTPGFQQHPDLLEMWDIGIFLKENANTDWNQIVPNVPKIAWTIQDAWPDSATLQF